MRKLVLAATMLASGFGAFAGSNTYDVNAGNGNGLRFWSSDSYKIHMGNATEYKFGPVKDYSIKMNMNNDAEGDRGWTWGVAGVKPVAALNMQGDMQLRKSLRVGSDEAVTYGMKENYADLSQNRLIMVEAGAYGDVASLEFDELLIRSVAPAAGLPFSSIKVGTAQFHGYSQGKLSLTSNVNGYAQGGYSLLTSGNIFKIVDFSDNSKTYLKITKNSDGSGVVAVDGRLEAEEIMVKNVGADYVFADDYQLRSLEEVEAFITANNHLPEIAPASQTEQGIEVGAFTEQLLMKVEELTLYMIELKKENNAMKVAIDGLK